MIVLDLVFNVVVGMYYMGHRETLMGEFMMRCPIAISPFIFLIEFIVVVCYSKYYERKTIKLEKDISSKAKKDIHLEVKKDIPLEIKKEIFLEVKKEIPEEKKDIISPSP